MNEEKFTDDNEFSELKKLLKDLPKVNVPDNFEFKLMTKIQNKNFETKLEKRKTWLSWSLTPAVIFATSVFIAFFVFSGNEESSDNPWNTLPRLMEENIAEADASSSDKEQFETSSNEVLLEKSGNPKELITSRSIKNDYPFEKNSSINFDDYLQSDTQKPTDIGAQLAGSQNSDASPFDGFFLRQRRDTQKRDSVINNNDTLQHRTRTNNNFEK